MFLNMNNSQVTHVRKFKIHPPLPSKIWYNIENKNRNILTHRAKWPLTKYGPAVVGDRYSGHAK